MGKKTIPIPSSVMARMCCAVLFMLPEQRALQRHGPQSARPNAQHGWDSPRGGWDPPGGGWDPLRGGWDPPRGGWDPLVCLRGSGSCGVAQDEEWARSCGSRPWWIENEFLKEQKKIVCGNRLMWLNWGIEIPEIDLLNWFQWMGLWNPLPSLTRTQAAFSIPSFHTY